MFIAKPNLKDDIKKTSGKSKNAICSVDYSQSFNAQKNCEKIEWDYGWLSDKVASIWEKLWFLKNEGSNEHIGLDGL